MIDQFVFVCESSATGATAHVKSLTKNTDDGVDSRSWFVIDNLRVHTLDFLLSTTFYDRQLMVVGCNF